MPPINVLNSTYRWYSSFGTGPFSWISFASKLIISYMILKGERMDLLLLLNPLFILSALCPCNLSKQWRVMFEPKVVERIRLAHIFPFRLA